MVTNTHRRSTPASRRQRGQALIWLLGTLAASAAVLYGVYNVGQLHTAKAKTVNAADAAALAGATVEARMLNLVAYNNRSMIANEVLLVQMLSIESWLGYFRNVANNFGTVADIVGVFIPPVEAIGKLLDETADIADTLRKDAVKPAINVVIQILELAKDGFKLAHGAVIAGGGLVAENAATKVVQSNRAAFGVHNDAGVEIDDRVAVRAATFLLNNERWIAFSKQYSGNQRTDAKQVLLDSRDGFSTDRPGQWYLKINAGLVGLEKLGGSQLKGFDRWEAEDTLELWEKGPKGKSYQPIGWGRANADKNGSTGSTWSPNRSAQKLAWKDGADYSFKNWTGVPAVYDIADKKQADRATLGIDFLVAVRRPKANTMTSANLGMGIKTDSAAGSSEMPERLQGDQISALAKARVSFERPQRNFADKTANTLFRADSAKEYGSLFSPYWQARLVDLTKIEKAGLMTAMGINPATSLFTPGGQN